RSIQQPIARAGVLLPPPTTRPASHSGPRQGKFVALQQSPHFCILQGQPRLAGSGPHQTNIGLMTLLGDGVMILRSLICWLCCCSHQVPQADSRPARRAPAAGCARLYSRRDARGPLHQKLPVLASSAGGQFRRLPRDRPMTSLATLVPFTKSIFIKRALLQISIAVVFLLGAPPGEARAGCDGSDDPSSSTECSSSTPNLSPCEPKQGATTGKCSLSVMKLAQSRTASRPILPNSREKP